MAGPITGIDHALVGVADLEGARDTWERLGFTVTPRGSHIGWGTANFCIMFPDDYIELLGIVDPAQFTNRLDEFLARRGEGLLGAALATGDAAGVDRAYPRQSLGVGELARRLELPEGTVLPRFRLCRLALEATPALSAFVIEHLSRELIWRPQWLRHACGASGIDAITGLVEDPAALTPAYRALFPEDQVKTGRESLEILLAAGQALRFLTPNRFTRRFGPEVTLPEPPASLALTVRTTDLEATGSHLRAHGIPLIPVLGDRLVVHPSAATGVVLEFVRA